MDTPTKIQNALIPSKGDLLPMKKAKQSVREVMVMDGPACLIPYFMRSAGGRFKGT